MLRINRVFASSLVFLVAGAMAPAGANASGISKLLHMHPKAAQTGEARIVVTVYNRGALFQDVKVDGKVYTVLPHQALEIKAPNGTPVYANSTGAGYNKGDLLFSINPSMKGATVSFN